MMEKPSNPYASGAHAVDHFKAIAFDEGMEAMAKALVQHLEQLCPSHLGPRGTLDRWICLEDWQYLRQELLGMAHRTIY